MKKVILFLMGCLLFTLVDAQDKFSKLQKEADSLIGTTVYGKNNAVGKFYDIRGFKMYCEVYGSGQPLLIIHGNGGSINNFVKQIPFFSQKYQVILADSRSQGKSLDNGDSLTYEMMADDYAALLTAMKIDSALVIGWSDGGINGLLLAIRHPEKVKKLAVTGANLRPDSTAVFPEILDMFAPSLKMMKSRKDLNAEQKIQLKLTKLLLEQPNIPLKDVQKIKVPALIIGGDHDVIKEEHTVEIYKQLVQGFLWILPNSGHSTPIVYTEEFNKVVDEFFAAPYRKIQKAGRFF